MVSFTGNSVCLQEYEFYIVFHTPPGGVPGYRTICIWTDSKLEKFHFHLFIRKKKFNCTRRLRRNKRKSIAKDFPRCIPFEKRDKFVSQIRRKLISTQRELELLQRLSLSTFMWVCVCAGVYIHKNKNALLRFSSISNYSKVKMSKKEESSGIKLLVASIYARKTLDIVTLQPS